MITSSFRYEFSTYSSYLMYRAIIASRRYPIILAALFYIARKMFSGNIKILSIMDYVKNLEGRPLIDKDKYIMADISNASCNLLLDVNDMYGEEIYRIKKSATINNNNNKINRKNVIYTFEKSGFFSTIFTLVNISYYCKKENIGLKLDWKNWQYPKKFDFILPSTSNCEECEKYYGQDELFMASRDFIDQLHPAKLIDYEKYRHNIIKLIYDWCDKNIDPYSKNEIFLIKEKNVCFIRRGDKLKNESYPLTINNYIDALRHIDDLVIAGDDYFFNNELSGKLKCDLYYPNSVKMSGSKLLNCDEDSLMSLLKNFYLLCNARNTVGDPYVNLYASALIFRNEAKGIRTNLYPWALRKYI